jgi:glycerophosphoryl diester phosphodiesterase
MKGPRSDALKPRYSCELAANLVNELVQKYNYHGRFLVSSFNSDILKEVEKMRDRVYGGRIQKVDGAPPSFEIIYLYNFENNPLPEPEVYTSFGDGINISANYITKEVVEACHRKNLRIGVWIRVKDFTETDEFYEEMFRIGTDFICADKPLRAMAAREKYFGSAV